MQTTFMTGEPLIQITPLPQLVPSPVCVSCEVCCRFPEPDSFLRPYFTSEEISRAIRHGVAADRFSDHHGCQVAVVPNPTGPGFLCPAFDPATSHCRIYEARPFDCQLYPLAMMWNAAHDQVLLGWDTKCPFMREQVLDGIQAFARRMMTLLERDDTIDTVVQHPRLVGRYQDDVVVLQPLPRLTERLVKNRDASPLTIHMSPFTLADRPRFEQAFAASKLISGRPLAAYSFAYHFIWRSHLSYAWAEIGDSLCLFAESPDGMFMPLPPLGAGSTTEPLEAVFRFMRERNRGSAVTRVENAPDSLKPQLEALGYRLSRKDPDYLYRSTDLVALAGDRFKAQRAACNRVGRKHRVQLDPYCKDDQDVCLLVFHQWKEQKTEHEMDEIGCHLLRDAESAHREVLADPDALGVVGAVARVDGRVRAYTFGYWLSPSLFCVLLEVADRQCPGLAQWMFREWCRTMQAQGAELINTMDDSGLPSLARSKRSYHPIALIPNWIVTEPHA